MDNFKEYALSMENASHLVLCDHQACDWTWSGQMGLRDRGIIDQATVWRVGVELETAVCSHQLQTVASDAEHKSFRVYHQEKGGQRLMGTIASNRFSAHFRPVTGSGSSWR